MVILKVLITIVIWIIAHKICAGFPYEFMEEIFDDTDGPQPYDYFKFYAMTYAIVFLIIILMF